MNVNMSGFLQFIIGFILGIIFFTAGIAGGAYLFLTKVAVNPTKPVFSEEKATQPPAKPVDGDNNQTAPSSTTNNTETSTPTNEEPTEEKLPEGAYRAKVIWDTGLSLRANPSKDAERIGGVGYNSELIVLSLSDDKNWQKVRIPSSGQEGWIKAGNVEKIEE